MKESIPPKTQIQRNFSSACLHVIISDTITFVPSSENNGQFFKYFSCHLLIFHSPLSL